MENNHKETEISVQSGHDELLPHGERSLLQLVSKKDTRQRQNGFGIKILLSITIAVLAVIIIPWLVKKGFGFWGIGDRLFFMENPLLAFIPYTIVLLFFGVLTYSVFNLVVSELRKVQLRNLIKLCEKQPDKFRTRINSEKGLVFFLLKALDSINHSDKNLNEKTNYLKSIIDVEYERNASSYNIPRLLIWAMPILGFIGTVLGISLAVGDFSGFLGAMDSAEDLELIKRGLSDISAGLSYAFDTTLLGLASSLVTMVVISLAESRDSTFFYVVEDVGVRIISDSAPVQSIPEAEKIQPHVEVFLQLVEKFDDKIMQYTNTLENASDTLLKHSKVITNNSIILTNNESILKQRISGFNEIMTKTNSDLMVSFGDFTALLNNLNSKTGDVINRLHQYVDRLEQKDISALIESIRTSVLESMHIISEAINGQMTEIQNGISNAMNDNSKLTATIAQHLNGDFLANIRSIQENNVELVRSLENFNGNNNESKNLFIDEVSKIQESQKKIASLLSELDSGFEIRLVSGK